MIGLETLLRVAVALAVLIPFFLASVQALEVMVRDRNIEWKESSVWTQVSLAPIIFLVLSARILGIMIKRRQLIVI